MLGTPIWFSFIIALVASQLMLELYEVLVKAIDNPTRPTTVPSCSNSIYLSILSSKSPLLHFYINSLTVIKQELFSFL